VVYVDTYATGAYYGTLLALNEQSGRLLWSFQIIGNMLATPAVVNGVVYVTDDHQTLYARNAMTGAPLWSYTGVSSYAAPTVVNGVVYVGSTAVNATTGKLLWRNSGVPGGFKNTAAVVNGVVYGVTGNGTLSALNAATGAVLWTYQDFSVRLVTSPAVANGVVYASLHGALYAFNATTGAKLWSRGSMFGYSLPAVANGVVYVSEGGKLYALDAATGAVIWSVDSISYEGFDSPVVANGVIHVSSGYSNMGYPGDTLYAIDASTGAKLWQYTGDNEFTPSWQTVGCSPGPGTTRSFTPSSPRFDRSRRHTSSRSHMRRCLARSEAAPLR
jgi:outer membrane protein assembly factor BamB